MKSSLDRRRGSVLQFAVAGYGAVALGVLTSPLQARALGPSARGELAAVTAYAILLSLVLGAGIPVAVKAASAQYPEKRDAILVAALRFTLWLPIPACLAAGALLFGPLSGLSGTARAGAFALTAFAPIAVARNCLHGRLVAEGALRPLSVMRVLPLVTVAGVTVALFAASQLNLRWSLALVQLVIVLEFGVAWRHCQWSKATERFPLGSLLRFGSRGLLSQVAETSILRLDQAILVSLVPVAALGRYSIAVTIATLPFVLSQAVSTRFFGLIGQAQGSERVALIERSIRLSLLVTALVCCALAAVSPVIVPRLYGPGFGDVLPTLLILLPGTVVFSAAYMSGQALVAVGRPSASGFAQLAGAAVTAMGIVPAARFLGIEGAAILSDLTYLATLVVVAAILRSYGVRRVLPGRTDLAELVAAVSLRLPQVGLLRPKEVY